MKITHLLLFLVLAHLSACYRIVYRVGDATDRTYTLRQWNHFFIQGLAPVDESRNLETLCPGSKILEVKTFVSPANVLAGVLGLGMTSSTSLEYTCAMPEERSSGSTGRVRDSLLSKLGLGGSSEGRNRREELP